MGSYELSKLAEELEDAALDTEDSTLRETLEDAAYEIRVRLGDVGALLGYWDDPRFADRRERDYRPEA